MLKVLTLSLSSRYQLSRFLSNVPPVGFSNLALIATFLTAVQAQMLASTLEHDEKNTLAFQAVNSCYLMAIVLSMFGAITGELSVSNLFFLCQTFLLLPCEQLFLPLVGLGVLLTASIKPGVT